MFNVQQTAVDRLLSFLLALAVFFPFRTVKSKIEEITGIKVRAQTLHIDVSFTDDSLLSEIGIASSQCWRLEVKQSVSQVPSIHVSIKDEILKLINPLEVNRNTTVSTLKELVEIRSGHQAEKLNLVLGLHKPPFKSQATLEDCE